MATKDDYQEIKEVIRTNKEYNKKILSQRKNRKFNSHKYNARGRSQHQTNQRDAISERSKSPFRNHFQGRNSQQQHKRRQAYQVNKDNQIYHIRESVEQRYRPTNRTREPTEERNRPTRREPTKSYAEVLRGSIFNSNRRKANVHFQRQNDVQEIFRGQSDAEFTSRADPKNYNTASVIRGSTNVFLMYAMEQTLETLSQNAKIMENLGENFKAFLEQNKTIWTSGKS